MNGSRLLRAKHATVRVKKQDVSTSKVFVSRGDEDLRGWCLPLLLRILLVIIDLFLFVIEGLCRNSASYKCTYSESVNVCWM